MGPMGRGIWYGLGGALLAAAGVALLLRRDLGSMEGAYLALLVLGTTGVSFAVGWVLGHLTEAGTEPGSDGRE